MRIVVDGRTIQDHFPGIARYTFHLADALARLAPETEWIILHDPAARNSRYDLDALARHLNVRLLPVAVPSFSPAAQTRLPRLARDLHADLWHAPYYIMPYRLPCPAILTFYDAIAHHVPGALAAAWKQPLFELLTHLAVRSARHYLAISSASRDDLVRFYGARPERVTITPLAADARFTPQTLAAIQAVRARYILPGGYVLYLGSNKPHKNIVRLIEAWASIKARSQMRGIQLVIAGHWDPRFPQARECASRLGLEESVRFAGPIASADLPAVFAGADLFVFPSLYEGFGLPVLEALACGTPVVCSNTSSLPEVAGDAALLVDPLDIEALARAIERVLGNGDLRSKMRQKGLAQAARFSWDRTAELTLSGYGLRRGTVKDHLQVAG